MAGQNSWTPVALASDLPKSGVMRAVVDGRDLAVWRSRAGEVRAWDNRCPHRGMRLSFGFVRGENLTCIYHGWQYGTDGICQSIPAHPDLTPPPTLCVTAFGCTERGGLVSVSLVDVADQPLTDLPHISDDAEPVRSLTIDQDIATIAWLLETTRFPLTETWQPDEGTYTSTDGADGLIIVEGKMADAGRKLIAALQPLPDNRTTIHVLTSPAASPAMKIKLSRWLECFRREAELPAIDTPASPPPTKAREA